MIKKLLFVVLLLGALLACISLSVSAEVISAPGGTVTSYEELKTALGGDAAVKQEDGYLLILSDLCLESPVVITKGEYELRGAGVVISASFESGSFFEVGGTEETALSFGSVDEEATNDNITLDGEGKTREGSLLMIGEKASVFLYTGTILQNNVTTVTGGAVSCDGSFAMCGGIIRNCRSIGSGGAIYSRGEVLLPAGTIESCSAEFGGAVYNEGTAAFVGTEISDCSASRGGAVFNAATMRFYSSSVTSCKASQGGGVYNSGEAVLEGGQIVSCLSEHGEGGGIYNSGTLTLKGTYLNENSAKNGGSLYNVGKSELSAGQLNRGVAELRGGNVFNDEKAQYSMTGGTVGAGKAAYGGNLYNFGIAHFSEGLIVNGKADVGGAMLNEGTLTLAQGIFFQEKNDLCVVITDDQAHAVRIESTMRPEQVAMLTPAVRNGDGYTVEYRAGAVLLFGDAVKTEYTRFRVSSNGATNWILSDRGALEKPIPVYYQPWFYLILLVAFFAVVTGLILLIRFLDKKHIVLFETKVSS